MISTALVPLDGSPAAEHAIHYAQAILPADGEIVLLHVLPDNHVLPELLGIHPEPSSEEGEVDLARILLEQARAGAGSDRFHWIIAVSRGDPATEIISAVVQHRAKVVVMTTQGLGALGRLMMGSVADRVARTAPVPVLLVRPGEHDRRDISIRRVVVPLDGSDQAERALPVAFDLARHLETPVHLLRVVNLAAILMPITGFGAAGVSPETYDETVKTVRDEAERYLEAVATQFTAVSVTPTWAVVEGSAFFSIAETTDSSDLIVMTSHGRGGLSRWLLGSVAEKLVREAPGPVLLVPAAGRGANDSGGGESAG